VLFIVGVVFLVLAGAAAGAFGVAAPLGGAIYVLAPAFLNTLQAGVQRNIAPWLWDYLFLPVLEAPSWLPFAVIGVLLIAIARRSRAGRGV